MTARKPAPLLMTAGLALLLAACSDGSTASEEPGEEGLRVASTSSSLSFAPLTTAIALDTFTDHGVEVQHTDFAASSPNALAALTGGEADIAVVGASNVFDALQAGADLTVIGGATTMASELGMNAELAQQLGVDRDTPIDERVQALKGLTIHTTPPGGTTSQTLRVILQLHGLDPDNDVTIVPSEASRIISGLADGSVDAAFWATGVMDSNYLDGTAIQYISLPMGDVPELTDSLFIMHVTTGEYLEENTAKVTAYMNAIRDAGDQMGGEPVAEVKDAYFPDMDEGLFASAWSSVQPAWIRDGSLTEEQWENSLELQVEITGKDYSGLDYATDVRLPDGS